MPVIRSLADRRSDGFRQNADAMRAAGSRPAYQGGRGSHRAAASAARERHLARGKLLPRDRVRTLLDPGSPFLELVQLAAYGMYGGEVPAAGIITGIGRVSGRECVIVANDATVKGGTYYPDDGEEASARAGDRAAEPAALHLSGRFRRRQPAEPGRGLSRPRAFRPHLLQPGATCRRPASRRSPWSWARCTAGGAYVPAMSDETVIVRNQGTIFLGGPPLVKAATGEVVTAEELGGADVHSRISGVADHYARERRACAGDRAAIVGNLEPREATGPRAARARASRATTRRDSTASSRPTTRKPYDVREVIARIVDGSELDEFKRLYGTTLVTGFAHIWGYPGRHPRQQRHPVLRDRALKGAHFIELCAQRGIPLRVPAEHHRLHGRPEIRGGRHRQGRREDGDGGRHAPRCRNSP